MNHLTSEQLFIIKALWNLRMKLVFGIVFIVVFIALLVIAIVLRDDIHVSICSFILDSVVAAGIGPMVKHYYGAIRQD